MFFLFLLLAAWQNSDDSPCLARLEMHQQDGFLTVEGHCRNLRPTAGHYRYELSLQRESASGRSQNTQRGEFDLAPQQEVSLARSQVNAGPQDTYHIHLRVLDQAGQVVAQDSAAQVPAR